MDQSNRWRKPPANGQGSQDGDADSARPMWPGSAARNGKGDGNAAYFGDESAEFNPPWELESGQFPIPPVARGMRADEANLEDDLLEPLLERSMAGMSLSGYSETGKITALPPLRRGGSWNRGIRAPRPGSAESVADAAASDSRRSLRSPSAEFDAQASMHVAALRTSTLLKATTIISAALLISRIFGLLRTTLFAAVLGYSATTDAYTLAFTLPDAIFNIVSGGALASAVIPVFNDYMVRRKDRSTAWKVASIALNTSMIALVGFCVIAIIFTEPVMRFFFANSAVNIFSCAKGVVCEGPLAVRLTQIMLLQPIFLGGATVAIALLQARQSFVAPAIGQVVYTLTVVGGIGATALDKQTHIFGGNLGIYGPTWGVVIGAVLQLVVQIPALFQAKMQYSPTVSFSHPGIIEIGRLMGPRIINSAVLYTSTFVSRILLVNIVTGVLTGYNTAFTLIQLPNGLIGMALAQAAFPTLSTLVSAREWGALRDNVLRAIKSIAYLTIPASIGLIVFARPITRLVVDYGAFHTSDLYTVYEPLIAFAVGLTGLSLVEILTRSFYALENTRTPTQVSILQFMFDIGMSVLMAAWGFGAWGIALASSLAWIGEALVLLIMLRQELAGLNLKELSGFMLKALAGAALAVAVAALVYKGSALVLVPQLINGEPVHSKVETVKFVVRMALSVATCAVAYFGLARFLRIDDVLPLERILGRVTARFKRR